jgi:hypothetical protein
MVTSRGSQGEISDSMDVFALRDSVIGEYERFATSFTTIRAADLRTKLKAFYEAGTYWPEPLIQLNPHYERDRTQAELVEGGVLHPKCPELFRLAAGVPLPLHKHQELAAVLATTDASYVVTSKAWGDDERARTLSAADLEKIIQVLLEAACGTPVAHEMITGGTIPVSPKSPKLPAAIQIWPPSGGSP